MNLGVFPAAKPRTFKMKNKICGLAGVKLRVRQMKTYTGEQVPSPLHLKEQMTVFACWSQQL